VALATHNATKGAMDSTAVPTRKEKKHFMYGQRFLPPHRALAERVEGATATA